MSEDAPGIETLWSRFALEREIGSGSMSKVFREYDKVLGVPVAVKVLRDPQNRRHWKMFLEEADISSELSHPCIVQTYEVGEGLLEGQRVPYTVMEYVSGVSLQSLIDEKGSLSGREVAEVGADIASALAYAHSKGVLHRDVKPSNILITPGNVAVLLDFTAERPIAAAVARSMSGRTRERLGVGRVRHTSPEQLQLEVGVGSASDIYSLGATLYQLVAGRPLFGGASLEVAQKHIEQRPTPLKKIAHVSDRLNNTIMRTLEKDPSLRPSASELASILAYDLLQRYCRRIWRGLLQRLS